MYRITTEPLDPEALAESVTVPEAGAVCVFLGVVRAETGSRRVLHLEYEAHPEMAETKMKEIGEEVSRRWRDVQRVAMAHRVGRLQIGEPSVIVAVSAGHRQQAFEACHFAIDRLKETVPIWKKEVFEDGETWVGLQGSCAHPV